MGIFLGLRVSKSVTQEEWAAVYEETLTLVDAFRLGELREMDVQGLPVTCLVPAIERKRVFGLWDEWEETGWMVCGDMDSLKTAEDFYTSNHFDDAEHDPGAGDPIVSALVPYGLDVGEEGFDKSFHLWGGKTQGEPYHMYLLAIGCLIQDRLGDKAYVTGDITRGQCVEATRLANEHLSTPIAVPDQCDTERLLNRVAKLPLSEAQRVEAVLSAYLGPQDAEFGGLLRSAYSSEDLGDYWRKRFSSSEIGTPAYAGKFKQCMNLGFALEEVVSWTHFEGDDVQQRLDFINVVMDAELHVAEKDCSDVLDDDPDDPGLYGVASQLAYFVFGVFGGLRNKRVNRYIPIETIRSTLKNAMGNEVDVDRAIDDRLTEEHGAPSPTDDFNAWVNGEVDQMRESGEQYEISRFSSLAYFKQGDTLAPFIAKALVNLRSFYSEILENARYRELLEYSWQTRCEYLVNNSGSILLSVYDWEKVFDDVRANDDSFARYFLAVRAKITSTDKRDVITAFVRNDDVYAYVMDA